MIQHELHCKVLKTFFKVFTQNLHRSHHKESLQYETFTSVISSLRSRKVTV